MVRGSVFQRKFSLEDHLLHQEGPLWKTSRTVVLLLQFPFLLTFCEQAWSGFTPWVVIEQKGSKATPDAGVLDDLRISPLCFVAPCRADGFTTLTFSPVPSFTRPVQSNEGFYHGGSKEGWSQGREWVSGGNFCDVSLQKL